MAKNSFRTRLITPEAQVLDEPATYVQLPAHDGSMGFLPGRAPIVAKLGIGELRIDFADQAAGGKGQGGSRSFLVEEGFAHMVENTLTVLATRATPVESIVEQTAQAELAEAEARPLAQVTDPGQRQRLTRQKEAARKKLALARQFRSRGGAI
ncbi:MAG TPA: F0F1 ATP synthase subunit epsilon [Phycisphaerales bacterium]|nr:F0F1 ATP synthase subunit epsilon [Phycisphaerales bacterium]